MRTANCQTLFVNVFTDDIHADEHRHTIMASHSSSKARFDRDWRGCLAAARRDRPDAWTVSDVFDAMEKRGWSMTDMATVAVRY